MGWALGVAILAAAIDLASKAWAHRYVPAGFGPASDGFVQLRWITNRGAALGLGAGHPLVVAGIAVLSTLVVGWWLSRTVSSGERFAVAVVLGGALGNLGDRLAHGAVTDWVHVAAYPATFNVADVCIALGSSSLSRSGRCTTAQPPAGLSLARSGHPSSCTAPDRFIRELKEHHGHDSLLRRSPRHNDDVKTTRNAPRPVWSTRREELVLFLRGVTVRVAGRVAVVVGTVLSAVNQGSLIVAGDATGATWIRVSVNYLTPFVVTSIGYLAGCRAEPAHTRPSKTGRAGAVHRVPSTGADENAGHDGDEGQD